MRHAVYATFMQFEKASSFSLHNTSQARCTKCLQNISLIIIQIIPSSDLATSISVLIWRSVTTPMGNRDSGRHIIDMTCSLKQLRHTYLAQGLPWSRRWCPQGEALPLHSGWADACDRPKCGWLGCVIFVSGGLRSRSPLIPNWTVAFQCLQTQLHWPWRN